VPRNLRARTHAAVPQFFYVSAKKHLRYYKSCAIQNVTQHTALKETAMLYALFVISVMLMGCEETSAATVYYAVAANVVGLCMFCVCVALLLRNDSKARWDTVQHYYNN